MKSAAVAPGAAAVEFCELLHKPFPHDSQVIRVNATLGRFRDYVTFYDSKCVPRHPLIKVTFSPAFEYDNKSEFTEKLLQIVSGTNDAKEGNVHVSVTAVGLFKAIPSTDRKDFTELTVRIHCYEDREHARAAGEGDNGGDCIGGHHGRALG